MGYGVGSGERIWIGRGMRGNGGEGHDLWVLRIGVVGSFFGIGIVFD